MVRRSEAFLWVYFGAASLLSFFVAQELWMFGRRGILLVSLGFLNCFLAGLILGRNARDRRTVVFVILGLVFGQLWAIETAFTFLFWSLKGFAP